MRYWNTLKIIISEISNPALSWYHLHHIINKFVSLRCAKSIANKNRLEYSKQEIGDILISSFDGSNQVVHPDLDIIGDKIVLFCTPYPYAMEEYENPCLYVGTDIYHLQALMCPIDSQSKHTQGVHMSDPCVAVDNETIYCIYRETQKENDFIYLKTVQLDEQSKPQPCERIVLLESLGNYILSPAVVLTKSDLLMYHVKTNKVVSELILNKFNRMDYKHGCEKSVSIENEPKGYFLWHIGIAATKDYGKVMEDGEQLSGLFLYINVKNKCDMKLFMALSEKGNNLKWRIEHELSFNGKLNDIMKFPYKSCFNPKTKKILLSFRDKKARNRLIEIDNK